MMIVHGPIHLAWCCLDQARRLHSAETIERTCQAADQAQPWVISACRRLGLASAMTYALMVARVASEVVVCRAPFYHLIGEMGVSCPRRYDLHNSPSYQVICEERELLFKAECSLNQGGCGHQHPFGPVMVADHEWNTQYWRGDPWHWLWILTQSLHLREQGERALGSLLADPSAKKRAKEAGLLPAIALNLCGALFPREDVAGLAGGRKPVDWYLQMKLNETCRFPAWYMTARLGFPHDTHEEVCQALGYPNPRFPNHPSIAQTIDRMREWLEG